MNLSPSRSLPLKRFASLLLIAAMFSVSASPAAAQYGGGPSLIVDPVRVPIEGTFNPFGSDCPPGSTVTITIDGIAGVLGTTISGDDSFFSVEDLQMPAGVIAGTDYVVRATCVGLSSTFVITAVCNDGTDPVGGVCTTGNTVGGGKTPVTTVPGSGGGGGETDLAVTGASFVESFLRIGVTLVAFGFAIVLVADRRREQQQQVDQPA